MKKENKEVLAFKNGDIIIAKRFGNKECAITFVNKAKDSGAGGLFFLGNDPCFCGCDVEDKDKMGYKYSYYILSKSDVEFITDDLFIIKDNSTLRYITQKTKRTIKVVEDTAYGWYNTESKELYDVLSYSKDDATRLKRDGDMVVEISMKYNIINTEELPPQGGGGNGDGDSEGGEGNEQQDNPSNESSTDTGNDSEDDGTGGDDKEDGNDSEDKELEEKHEAQEAQEADGEPDGKAKGKGKGKATGHAKNETKDITSHPSFPIANEHRELYGDGVCKCYDCDLYRTFIGGF